MLLWKRNTLHIADYLAQTGFTFSFKDIADRTTCFYSFKRSNNFTHKWLLEDFWISNFVLTDKMILIYFFHSFWLGQS